MNQRLTPTTERRDKKILLTLGCVTVAAHFLIAVTHDGPVAVPDVPAYLSISQWVMGSQLVPDLPFHPGYGLILAPFGWLSGDQLHTAALLVNGLLAVGAIVLTARITQLLAAPRWVVLLCATLAAVHPSVSLGSRVAWPEPLLAVLLLGIFVEFVSKRTTRWPLIGVLTSFGVLVHPRAITMVGAALLGALFVGKFRSLSLGLLPGLGISLLLLQLTDTWQTARLSALVGGGVGPSGLEVAAGELLAISAATAGLAAVGVVLGLESMRRNKRGNEVHVAANFMFVSFAGTLFLGAVSLAGGARLDVLLYGRYIDPWTLPLMLLGTWSLIQQPLSKGKAALLVFLISCSAIIVLTAQREPLGDARRIMALSLGGLWGALNNQIVSIVVMAATIAILGLLTASIGNRMRVVAPLAATLVIAFVSSVSDHLYLDRVGDVAAGQVTTAALLPASQACLSHDLDSSKPYAIWLYRLQLPDVRHQHVDLSKGDVPCGSYVIAGEKTLSDCDGARLVGVEPAARWGLWRYPVHGCG